MAPDGRHYSFVSNESGRYEVYVAAIGNAAKTTVSANGGLAPRWSADGRELYYLSAGRRLMSVPVRTTPSWEVGTPVTLFQIGGRRWTDYDASPDGPRFLAAIGS